MNTKELKQHERNTEEASPDPEYLIKSISEQGYSLETSLADLIDNSITANANNIEILIKTDDLPFSLFVTDNGDGMSETELKENLKFPSSSPERIRSSQDLGRFGLGLKTASFAQTRCFTVLSRKKGSQKFNARTWDVEYLKANKQWRIIINTDEEIDIILNQYKALSNSYLAAFDEHLPNTIILWNGLYKFEEYLSDKSKSIELKKEITEITSGYLSLVFHRFLESTNKPLNIRINNVRLKPFNPFPTDQFDFRKLETNRRQFQDDHVKIEGYILPSRSLDESNQAGSIWNQHGKSLLDMEGLYIYRANRIILYGGWNGIIKKSPRLQLARLMVDIGNGIDKYFHLNVAKSSIAIPHDLRISFLRCITELKKEAEKEFFNRGIKKMSSAQNSLPEHLFMRVSSNKGMLLEINEKFSLLNHLASQLTTDQNKILKIILRMVNTTINKMRQIHENNIYSEIEDKDRLDTEGLSNMIGILKQQGFSSEKIKDLINTGMGIQIDSLPNEILELLKSRK